MNWTEFVTNGCDILSKQIPFEETEKMSSYAEESLELK